MNHLHEKTRAFINSLNDLSMKEKRIEFIRRGFWIPYPIATKVMERMEEILIYPRVYRMPGLLLVAHSNNGKSSILRRFAQKHPAFVTPDGYVNAPVLPIVMPEIPSEKSFPSAILMTTNSDFKATDRTESRIQLMYQVLRALNCKIILLDEVHHLSSAGPRQQRHILNMIKNISTLLQISFIAAGTPEALSVFSSDEQMENRFKPAGLPRWQNNLEFRQLLQSIEMLLPLKEPSNLASEHGDFIYNNFDGTIGDLIGWLSVSAVEAIQMNKEKLTRELMKNSNHMSPSQIINERKRMLL